MVGDSTKKLLDELARSGRGEIRPFIDLIDEYFKDKEAKEIAMYMVAKVARDELLTMAVATGKESVPLPVTMLQAIELYESQKATNKFYHENFYLIEVVMATDSIQTEAFKNLLVKDKEVAKYVSGARLGALIGLHYIYSKDVNRSVEFATKLRKIMTPDEKLKSFFK